MKNFQRRVYNVLNNRKKKKESATSVGSEKKVPKISVITPMTMSSKRNSPTVFKDSTTPMIKEEESQKKTNETTAQKKKELKKRMTIELSLLRKTTMKKKKTYNVNFEVLDDWIRNRD